ncbi:carboxylate-amine ligase [Streptacidiphilus rugosus]|uniref:carboxylate-amine ligase n=1 Tax=Streptacidiphilus rugosus TaxID=405783 RepID=UPI001E61A733|nr:glutamate--cysteine ligase [Streptacidiphilus rugosus]
MGPVHSHDTISPTVPAEAAACGTTPSLGVEEEFLLVAPGTGRPVPMADAVRSLALEEDGLASEEGEVQAEFLQVQLEIATPVCSGLDEVAGQLLRLRHLLGDAAERAGCCLAACGAATVSGNDRMEVTPESRYLSMRDDAGQLANEQLINGMHVHVGVPDRETRVDLLNRLRPWLVLITALAANSPLWHGRDTGFASWRSLVFGRWPVTGVPPLFRDAEDYDARVAGLVDRGLIADQRQVYWLARLSDRHPTVEVRAADVQLRVDDAVMIAGLVRALAMTLLEDESARRASEVCPPEVLAAGAWRAARHGVTGDLLDPWSGRERRAHDVLADMVAYLRPALGRAGDAREIVPHLERLMDEGNGAERQRRTLQERGLTGLNEFIVSQTSALTG